MAKAVLVMLAIGLIAYGGYSVIWGGGDEPDPQPGPDAGKPSGTADPQGPGAGSGGTAPKGPSSTELMEQAGKLILQAKEAPDAGAALSAKDQARKLAWSAYRRADGADAQKRAKDLLDALNADVLFGRRARPGKSLLYRVEPGDILYNLCAKKWRKSHSIRVEPGFVMWLNGIKDARRIREGNILKVPLEELSLVVHKARFRLWVMLGDVGVKEFAVGIGANDSTPEGEFEIETKIENPAWYDQKEGRKVAFGHPDNPLGTRWMGFKSTREAEGYGVHGTKEPDTIGKDVSQGCIRLRNEDVEALFTWVPRGTKVKILR